MPGKLAPHQVILISDNQVPYIYDIEDKEEYAFLESRGERDEDGNLVLKMPLVAAARRFTLESVMKNIAKHETELGIPSITIGFEPNDNFGIKGHSQL